MPRKRVLDVQPKPKIHEKEHGKHRQGHKADHCCDSFSALFYGNSNWNTWHCFDRCCGLACDNNNNRFLWSLYDSRHKHLHGKEVELNATRLIAGLTNQPKPHWLPVPKHM